MGYKTLSENSGAVRALRPANEKPSPLFSYSDSTSKTFFFFFFKETDLSVTRVFGTFVGFPTGEAAQCNFSVQNAIMVRGGGHEPVCDSHQPRAPQSTFLLRVKFQLPTEHCLIKCIPFT